LKPLYIFDLDGTLALIEHRRKYVSLLPGSAVMVQGKAALYAGPNEKIEGDYWIDFGPGIGTYSYHPSDVKFKPNWSAFFAACVDDKPNAPVITVLHSLRYAAADIRIFSGRSDEVREETVTWLTTHTNLRPRELLGPMLRMRKQGDYTPDEVLKKQWFDELSTHDRMRLMCVFDDRDKVVKMWRDEGVACFQMAPGEF
jgi:hypothetical protein